MIFQTRKNTVFRWIKKAQMSVISKAPKINLQISNKIQTPRSIIQTKPQNKGQSIIYGLPL